MLKFNLFPPLLEMCDILYEINCVPIDKKGSSNDVK